MDEKDTATLDPEQVEKLADSLGVPSESEPVSSDTPVPTQEEDTQVQALKAELARRKGQAAKVADLERQLERIQAQLAQAQQDTEAARRQSSQNTLEAAIAKLDDQTILTRQTDWEDELIDARVALYTAQQESEKKAAVDRIQWAKQVLAGLRRESQSRINHQVNQRLVEKDIRQTANQEISSLYESFSQQYPDLHNKDSALWKASNDEYLTHPTLMKSLGPLGEIVAIASAIGKNPDLVGRKASEKLLDNLEQATRKGPSLKGSTSSVKGVPDYSSMPIDEFEKVVAKMKGL